MYEPSRAANPASLNNSMLNRNVRNSLSLVILMLFSSFAAMDFGVYGALGSSSADPDGDGLSTQVEYLIGSSPNNWDEDADGLPDGWEWFYGLDLFSANPLGDPDSDSLNNLAEYNYNIPVGWDDTATPNILDQGVWWNGTTPVNNWNEEGVNGYSRPLCGDAGSDGLGSIILCDEDPIGNICTDGFDNDGDGLVDSADNIPPINDGDMDCATNDDDGDGLMDEDPNGWDSDGDGMPDGWEHTYGIDATSAAGNDGALGDFDSDGLVNLAEYVNPSWDTDCDGTPCWQPDIDPTAATQTTTPCNPNLNLGPGGCNGLTAEVDGLTQTNPTLADTDGDGLSDGAEANVHFTDPTAADTDGDGINDGLEINAAYGTLPNTRPMNPLSEDSDSDGILDKDEDLDLDGVLDPGETDPTMPQTSNDTDGDGIMDWQENASCTNWLEIDTDFGGLTDAEEGEAQRGTDACDTIINFMTTISAPLGTGGAGKLPLTSGIGFNPSGGSGYYNDSGTYTLFTYSATVNDVLQGVVIPVPSGVTNVENRNGSWCNAAGTGPLYCDDDFFDADGDGLANWQEDSFYNPLNPSNPTLTDTDGDGVNDFQEVMVDSTDADEPCSNSLDDDLDGINNYFEENTGCLLSYIISNAGGVDTHLTDPDLADTDSGGVLDLQEYKDSTDPNDPLDDLIPPDFDGDGMPDAMENLSGTDWRNPDTDGGGLSDGTECPPSSWTPSGCVSVYDPLDPSDDISDTIEVLFYANFTAGVVDQGRVHYWRTNTYDKYTGAAYGTEIDMHLAAQITTPYSNSTDLAGPTFSSATVTWEVSFVGPLTEPDVIPMPAYANQITAWSDAGGEVMRTNGTHRYNVSANAITSYTAIEHEYEYDWGTNAANTIPSTLSPYELETDASFNNPMHAYNIVKTTTDTVISGATDAHSKLMAIRAYLRGESGTSFQRNYDGSNLQPGDDLAYHIIDSAQQGTCAEFNTVFITMARLAGIPTRAVSGYKDGTWNGAGYTVYSDDFAYWAESRISLSPLSTDMGWVPFEACPDASQIEITNLQWSPTDYDRDGSTEVEITGELVYSNNMTGAEGITLTGFVLEPGDFASLSPSQDLGRVGENLTIVGGEFRINGTIKEVGLPGFNNIIIHHRQSGYVSSSIITLAPFINVTDDSLLIHESPATVNAPVLGAGANTTISGQLLLEETVQMGAGAVAAIQVKLTFTSSVNGSNTWFGDVAENGQWSIEVQLDANENQAIIAAQLVFDGWVDTSQMVGSPAHHLRPVTLPISIDIRQAPKLTATIEGPGSANEIFILGEDVFINGTAESQGSSPSPMSGSLFFGIRQNNSGTEFIEIFNRSIGINGVISEVVTLAVDLQVPAGEIEPSLIFYPSTIDTTDQLSTVATGWWLKGIISFDIQAGPQQRGDPSVIIIRVTDHMGQNSDINFSGNYDFDFDSSWVNTTEDPVSSTLQPQFDFLANLPAADYPFSVSFNGSDNFTTSSADFTVRIKAEIAFNFTIGQDWTHGGNSTWVTGDIFDPVLNTRITDNQTELTLMIMDEFGVLIEIGMGSSALNLTNGEFNISITAPMVFSGVYDVEVRADFALHAGVMGVFYGWVDADPMNPVQPSFEMGIETEYKVQSEENRIIVVMNQPQTLLARVTDAMGDGMIGGANVEFIFDWGGANTTLGTQVSDGTGNASQSWTPTGIAPGYYTLRLSIADDAAVVGLPSGATQRLGNFTDVNVTIQVDSNIRIDVLDTTLIADTNFILQGQVTDPGGLDLIDPVLLEVFWLGNPDEKLIVASQTLANGTFDLLVPTDTAGNGTERGAQTVVISVVENSSEFYLTSTASQAVNVMGVTSIDQLQPFNQVIITRGNDVDLASRLIESSHLNDPLAGQSVSVMFDTTPLGVQTTSGGGWANFTHSIPLNQRLGPIIITFTYTGSSDLLSTETNMTNIRIRSTTVLVINAVTENPVAGEMFNVTGTISSDNGSNLTTVNGNRLIANLIFMVDGSLSEGFSFSNGTIQEDGTWRGEITLDSTFARGAHTINATFVPGSATHYNRSTDEVIFDSRGFSILTYSSPTLDGLGQPSLAHRTNRGDDLTVNINLADNLGDAIEGGEITVILAGTAVSVSSITLADGSVEIIIGVPSTMAPGIATLSATYDGEAGVNGILGSMKNITFIVLAQTNITILEGQELVQAGHMFNVSGTLKDDLNNSLLSGGVVAGGVVHLLVDGNEVASVFSDAVSGNFTISHTMALDSSVGLHNIELRFTGGRDWVDPIGVGDNLNPEYYWPSSATFEFNVSVPTSIVLIGSGGEVDRDSAMTIMGRLIDIVDNPLPSQQIDIYVEGEFVTSALTDSNGLFTAIYVVDNEAELGANDVTVRFNASVFYLESSANDTWYIFSPIVVNVSIGDRLSVGEPTNITGSVKDNNLNGISGLGITLIVEGIIIGNVTSGENGTFYMMWIVDDRFADGVNQLSAVVPAQGWYRSGQANTTFDLAHRSQLNLEFDSGVEATRGGSWLLSGRLFDIDDAGKGLKDETVSIYLDNQLMMNTTTDLNGSWTVVLIATMDLSRGVHKIEVDFAGSSGHLPSNSTRVVRVWANVEVHIDTISSIAIRSDSVGMPLEITGRVIENGGNEVQLDFVNLTLGNGTGCIVSAGGAKCINEVSITWEDGVFTMLVTVPSWMDQGMTFLVVESEQLGPQFFKSNSNVTPGFFLQIDAEIIIFVEPVIENEQEIVMGTVTIRAKDTGEGVQDISIGVFLDDQNDTRLDDMEITTDGSGVATFKFNAEPPYGDYSTYGPLNLSFILNEDRTGFSIFSNSTYNDFAQDSLAGYSPVYAFEEPPTEIPLWAYGVAILIIGGIITTIIMLRRRQADELKDFADIFSYTAELLAAGDSIRESIFNCYESLVILLLNRGFLRRDFETVREFEMAIRQAIPISEEAISSLDNMFEEARYSRNEMSDEHKAQAQAALTTVVSEINQIEMIPAR